MWIEDSCPATPCTVTATKPVFLSCTVASLTSWSVFANRVTSPTLCFNYASNRNYTYCGFNTILTKHLATKLDF